MKNITNKNATINKAVITGTILCALSVGQMAHAQNSNAQDWKESHGYDQKTERENMVKGMGGLAVVGAGVGGPIGAIVGGALGLYIGKDANNDKRTEDLYADLNQSQQQLDDKQAQYLALQNEYQNTLIALKQLEQQQASVQLAAMPKETAPVDLTELMNSQAHIQFKTASFQLEQHYVEQLDIVAEQLKADPKLVVQLFGYADRRGDENYNLTLSEKRADQVQRYLISKGVSKNQIETAGYGEAQPVTVNQTWENDFFDRRVVVRLTSEDAVMTAKQ